MKKTYLYNDIEKTMCICFPFTQSHRQALFQVYANDGCAEFENRNSNLCEDVDGNNISWKICDELVEMGLLEEDEESYDVYFELTKEGKDILNDLA
jgi:hypothetical protein